MSLCEYRRIEQLESSNDDEVATLPVSHSRGMGMRSISHGSLDGTTAIAALHAPPLLRAASPDVEAVTSRTHLVSFTTFTTTHVCEHCGNRMVCSYRHQGPLHQTVVIQCTQSVVPRHLVNCSILWITRRLFLLRSYVS